MKSFPLLILLAFTVTAYAGDTLSPAPQSIKPFAITEKTDIPVFFAGIAFAGAGFALEQSEQPLTQQEIDGLSRNSVNWFDRSATYYYSKTIDGISSILVDLAIAAPLGLLADCKIRETIITYSLMYAEVEMFSYVLPCLGKGFFKRPRPFDYNPAVPLDVKQSDDSRASFFSRHTTFVFASASFISTMYGAYHPESRLRPYVWAGSLAAASVVGYMRYRAGYHFPTDILTGALAGMLVGCGVPLLHKTKNDGPCLSLIPVNDGFRLSLELNKKYR
ncbi:MAG: phosphatase PAP2 family protein [Chitinispirillaceae bacterium]|jgi:membrane-associated phospholipid phosphatase